MRPTIDHTQEFKKLVSVADPGGSNAARRERQRQIERGNAGAAGGGGKKSSEDAARRRRGEQEWIAEAYRIKRHIDSLLSFLSSIRRAYLNIDATRPGLAGGRSRGGVDLSSDETSGSFARWADVRYLDERECDEVDFQARVVIKRCLDRVRELEKAEQVRQATSRAPAVNALSRLLSLSPGHTDSSDQLRAHRAAITHYLSAQLADVSTRQRDMQERRIAARREQSRTLAASGLGGAGAGAGAGGETGLLGSAAGPSAQPTAISKTSTTRGTAPLQGSMGGITDSSFDGTNGSGLGDIDSELTAAQMQEFESENSALIREMESQLASIAAAETKLLEISELQTQLVQHLGEQAEMTDRLFDEAIGHSATVEEGNRQLKQARERNRSANKWLSIFLVFSALCLLFLHMYD